MGRISRFNYLDDTANTYNGNGTAEIVYANGGNDTVFGQGGNDQLYGGNGNDVLHGDSGNDYLHGGNGDDLLLDDSSNNTLVGGYGRDTFVAFDSELNTILDFVSGVDKLFYYGNTYYNESTVESTIQGGKGINPDEFVLGTQASTPFQYFIYDKVTGNLYYDYDGSGSGSASVIATLVGSPNLTAADLVVPNWWGE